MPTPGPDTGTPMVASRRSALRAEAAVAAALRGDPVPARFPPGFVEAVAFHGVAGSVRRRLAAHTSATELVEALDSLRLTGLRTHLGAVAELAVLRPVLDTVGTPWLVVKGPVLAETVHDQPDLRTYSDLDVVVPARHFVASVEALEAAGGEVGGDNWWHRVERCAGELPITMPSGTVIDLHWHLVNNVDVRRTLRLSMSELFARAVGVEVRGERVVTLDPVDTALHLLVHNTTSGADRLVWLTDIDRLVARDRVDWDALVERAQRTRTALIAAVALARTHAVLGTPVPADVLRALDPGARWRTVAALARRIPRRTPNGRYATLERAVAKATRASVAPSARALFGRALARNAPDDDVTMAPRDHDPAARNEGRRAFLELIDRLAE